MARKAVQVAGNPKWPASNIEWRQTRDLLAYQRNSRIHSDAQVDQIAASMKEFGWTIPMLIDDDGIIIAGHGRALAAAKIGISEVPVMIAKGWTEAQKMAYRIADNRLPESASWDTDMLKLELTELGKMDFDLSLTGFDDLELVQFMATPNPNDPEEVPEPPVNPCSRAGDLWLLGNHRILCGDSTDADNINSVLNGSLADTVFTSPPYAVGVDYDSYNDTIENLRDILPKVAELWLDVLKPGGFAVINFGDIASGSKVAGVSEPCEYPMGIEYWPAFRTAGWVLWARRIWCKPTPRVNSLQCIGSNRAATDWEHIWTWKRPGKAIIARVDGDFSSVNGWLDTSKEHGVDIGKEIHGAGMAIAPAIRMINIHSRHQSVVFEPFSGTGTTLIAAEMTHRKCAAIEISEAYTDVAVQRWQTYTGQEATLEATGETYAEVADKRLNAPVKPARKRKAVV